MCELWPDYQTAEIRDVNRSGWGRVGIPLRRNSGTAATCFPVPKKKRIEILL